MFKRLRYWLYVRWCWWHGIVPADVPGLSRNTDAEREYSKMIKPHELRGD